VKAGGDTWPLCSTRDALSHHFYEGDVDGATGATNVATTGATAGADAGFWARTDVHDSQRTCEAVLNADTRVRLLLLVSCLLSLVLIPAGALCNEQYAMSTMQ
jgi:hypothetical protein